MKIIYHNDLDGKCAANLIFAEAKVLRNSPFDSPITLKKEDFIAADYKTEIDYSVIKAFDVVIIVDYHIPPLAMDGLIKRVGAENIIWIDHHKSAIEKYERSGVDISGIQGIRDIRHSGAYLTYCWLEFKKRYGKRYGDLPIKDYEADDYEYLTRYAPSYIKLIDDWDTFNWKKKGNVDAYHYMLGCNIYDLDPWDKDAWHAAKTCTGSYIERGQIIAEYKKSYAKEVLRRTGFVTEIGEYKAYAADFPFCTSIDFEENEEAQECDILAPYYRTNDGKYTVSLYSEKNFVDCAKIAQKYGGGGHKGAAGFSCDDLPFKK